METIKTNQTVDAKNLSCPMPIVKTKKAMHELTHGQVVEVQATDKGSTADLKAWAESCGHQYLGTIEENGILKHYLRKASTDEKLDKQHPHTIANEELQKLLAQQEGIILVDVREPAEFAFKHIAGAISIPLGELEAKLDSLDKESTLYIICRTGNRSDLVCQKLIEQGFTKVINVVPGMSKWTGPTTGITPGK